MKSLDFRKISSKLYSDYLYDYSKLASFFNGDPKERAFLKRISDQLAGVESRLPQLKSILERQNREADKKNVAGALLSKFDDPACRVVVTGQQAGLMLGPLYSVYKAITAVKLAREVEEEYGFPVVPVFWIEVNDHDFDEVREFNIQAQNGDVKKYLYGSEDTRKLPVDVRKLEQSVAELLGELREQTGSSQNAAESLNLIESIYQTGVSFADSFSHYFRASFPDLPLLFINPADPEVKQLAKDFYIKVANEHSEVSEALAETSSALASSGYKVQVSVDPAQARLFTLTDSGERVRVDSDALNSSDKSVKFVEGAINTLSGDVLLRPLYQDYLMPTIAYVAGPGEVAYMAQVKGAYEKLGLVMPVIYPRWSGTIIEKKSAQFLETNKIMAEDLFNSDLNAFIEVVKEKNKDDGLSSVIEEVTVNLANDFDKLRLIAGRIEPSLLKMLEQSEGKMKFNYEKIGSKLANALNTKSNNSAERARRTFYAIRPNGKHQERVYSILNFQLRYGAGFNRFVEESVTTEFSTHHIINY